LKDYPKQVFVWPNLKEVTMAAVLEVALEKIGLGVPASWKKGITKSPHGLFPCKGNRKGYWGFIAVPGEKDVHVWSGNRGGIAIKEGSLILTTHRNAFFPQHNAPSADVTIYHLIASENGKNEAIPWITEGDLLDYVEHFLEGKTPIYRIVPFSDAKSAFVSLEKPNIGSARRPKEIQQWNPQLEAWRRMPLSEEAKAASEVQVPATA
jgi:hypothetical protein